MKKIIAILLAMVMLLGLCACAKTEEPATTPAPAADNTPQETSAPETEAPAVDQATFEELLEAGKKNGNKLTIYSTHSVAVSAVEAFANKFGIDINMVEGTQIGDNNQITQVATEVSSGVSGADVIFIQDGARTVSELVDEGYVYNWYNQEILDAVGADCEPLLVWDYCNKVFIYSTDYVADGEISNIWYATDPQYAGTVQMKNPEKEGVNMNFLVMLTSDAWAEKLAAAYKDWKGEEIDLGFYKNAGYKWIAEFLGNCTFGSSDTTIAEEVSQETAAGKIGLFVLSKLRSSSVLTDNLTVAQYDASENGYTVEPFSGFMYPMYAMISANATRPYTAMLFIEYLMTQEGFQPWGKSIGAYSTSTAVTPNEGDLDITVWKDTLVMEDPEYILDNFDDVSTFAIKYIQK